MVDEPSQHRHRNNGDRGPQRAKAAAATSAPSFSVFFSEKMARLLGGADNFRRAPVTDALGDEDGEAVREPAMWADTARKSATKGDEASAPAEVWR